MRSLLPDLHSWFSSGRRVALATVTRTWGSSPRPLGSHLAVSDDGAMSGSVSGGCVEGAVVEEALSVLAGAPPRLLDYGVDDETAWSVGLSCGGSLEVLVRALAGPGDPLFDAVVEVLGSRRLAVRVTRLDDGGRGRELLVWPSGETLGDLGAPRLNQRVALFVQQTLGHSGAQRKRFPTAGGGSAEVLLEPLEPPERLVVVGAVHAAIPLVRLARELGFETVVVDPRSAFATRERFPEADRLLVAWPGDVLGEDVPLDGSTSLATLSHDPKIDLPALEAALASPCRYIGALGSTRTQAKRVAALEEHGFSADDIARLHAPIGLDLGGRRAEEIALAVIAEVVAVRHGGGVLGRRSG